MNRMLKCKVLDNLYRRNHITVCRDNDSNITTLRKDINEHTRCHPYIRFLFFVSLNFKTTVLTLHFLFFVKAQMKFEFRIDFVGLEKFVLVVICLRIINRTGRIVIHFY